MRSHDKFEPCRLTCGPFAAASVGRAFGIDNDSQSIAAAATCRQDIVLEVVQLSAGAPRSGASGRGCCGRTAPWWPASLRVAAAPASGPRGCGAPCPYDSHLEQASLLGLSGTYLIIGEDYWVVELKKCIWTD